MFLTRIPRARSASPRSGCPSRGEAQRRRVRREIWELESGVQSSSGYLHFGKTGLFSALRMGLR